MAARRTAYRHWALIFTQTPEHGRSRKDYEDVAAYLSSLDLSSDERFNIQPAFGDAKKGNKIYRTDCRNCHNANGYGKPSKEAPPLADQHPACLYTTEKGVTTEAAETAMIAKAKEIGLKKVAQQKVSQFLSKQGVEMPHLSIFQFCNPLDARLMVIADPVFSSYMPCRISMVEDADGKMWLMMLNLDMLINSSLLISPGCRHSLHGPRLHGYRSVRDK